MAKIYNISIRNVDNDEEVFYDVAIADSFDDACEIVKQEYLSTLYCEERDAKSQDC